MPRDVSLASTHAASLRRIFFMDRALSGISLAVKAGRISRTTDAFRFRWRRRVAARTAVGGRAGQNPTVESTYAATQKTAVRFLARRSTKRETDDGGEDAAAGTKAGSFLLIPSPGRSHYWRSTKPPSVTVNTHRMHTRASCESSHYKLLACVSAARTNYLSISRAWNFQSPNSI